MQLTKYTGLIIYICTLFTRKCWESNKKADDSQLRANHSDYE